MSSILVYRRNGRRAISPFFVILYMEFRKLLFVGVVLLFSCNDEKKLLNIVLPEDSGITFSNTIIDSDTFNIMTDEYIYNGGGVGIGDFNKDGLPDIFFTGNMAGNGLFINKGNLKFEDISETAGIKALDHWNTGLAVIDINQDGWQDIYVCASLLKDSLARTNQLFVNQGLDANGNPTFVDMAHQYGIADAGHSTYAAFFDYDNDGDLDLYILNNTRQNL
ncbi:MAG: VCBS repeat-containing protein, partial [Cyclobacteriaceae bacterium]|nr:VCBS repeat-containing protein [Cyclobacteriaceae bacterium]